MHYAIIQSAFDSKCRQIFIDLNIGWDFESDIESERWSSVTLGIPAHRSYVYDSLESTVNGNTEALQLKVVVKAGGLISISHIAIT